MGKFDLTESNFRMRQSLPIWKTLLPVMGTPFDNVDPYTILLYLTGPDNRVKVRRQIKLVSTKGIIPNFTCPGNSG
jgi:hypothetical protein